MITVTANHVHPNWRLNRQAFADCEIGEFGDYRVGGDATNGYYAIAPHFGCGRTAHSIERAISDLLISNGCENIKIERD